jgi:hypothetical protein
MKTTGILFSLILLSCFIQAQTIQPLRDGKKITTLTERRGKVLYSYSCTEDIKPLFLQTSNNESSKLTPSQSAGVLANKTLQTHHIVFHFDAEGQYLMVNGTDTLFTSSLNMNWINSMEVEADIPDGYYILYCQKFTYSNAYFVTKENFHVYQDMDTTITIASAIHHVTLTCNDENGIPVTEEGHLDGMIVCYQFPFGYENQNAIYQVAGTSTEDFFFSETSPLIMISMAMQKIPEIKPYHQYLITYPAQAGIHGNLDLQNSAASLGRYPVILHSPASTGSTYLGYCFGTMFNDSLTGTHLPSMIIETNTNTYPANSTDTVLVFGNVSTSDTVPALFAGGILQSKAQNFLPGPWTLTSPMFYVDKNKVLVCSEAGVYPYGQGDCPVANGLTTDLGITAPYNVTYGYSVTPGNTIDINTHYEGQMNEERNMDYSKSTFDIWQNGLLCHHDTLRTNHLVYTVPVAGIYTLILNDSNYQVFDKPGYLQSQMMFDLSNFSDQNSPTLLAFKVLNGNSVSREVMRGFPASVEFSAGDFTCPAGFRKIFHMTESAELYFKEYSEPDWHPLVITPLPAFLDSVNGMPYLADLASVQSAYSDSVWIDLKVMLADSAGNTTTQILHPAFLLRDVIAGTGKSLADNLFSIYPNPVKNKLFLVSKEDHFTYSVYTASGQMIMQGKDNKDLDVSGFSRGLYILKFESGSKSAFAKFIK